MDSDTRAGSAAFRTNPTDFMKTETSLSCYQDLAITYSEYADGHECLSYTA